MSLSAPSPSKANSLFGVNPAWLTVGMERFVTELAGSLSPITAQIQQAELEARFAKALNNQQFHLALQPIVAADTWRLVHSEGLLRYRADDDVLFTAADIIPLAERLNLVQSLDVYALNTACRLLRTATQSSMSINISRKSLENPVWRASLKEAITELPDLHQRLIIEITETALPASPRDLRSFVEFLQTQGVQVAIDDFGSGVTSWEELEQMDVNFIKFDKSVTQAVCSAQDSHVQQFLNQSVSRAKARGITTVAEGIETHEDAAALKQSGVDLLQGYLFGKPRP